MPTSEGIGAAKQPIVSRLAGTIMANDIKEIVKNDINGFLFDLENEEAPARILMWLYKDQYLKQAIGKEALKSAQAYSTENMVKQYCKIYEK